MLHLVGAGFLGSLFFEEWLKRCFALEHVFPIKLHDFDTFEDRNAANQNVTPFAAKEGVKKVDYLSAMADKYFCPEVTTNAEKLTVENIDKHLAGAVLVISAVDNYETRKLLWDYCLGKDIPIMHLGISQSGTGSVEWSWGDHYETWPLCPESLGGKSLPEQQIKRLPPCELVGLRGLGVNTGLAAAKALGLLLGHDPEGYFGETAQPDLFTVWATTNHGHKMVEAVLFDEDKNGNPRPVPASAKY